MTAYLTAYLTQKNNIKIKNNLKKYINIINNGRIYLS